jgi:hypothetical protein
MRWIWWRSATCCGPGTALVIASWPRRWASWLGGWPTGSGGSRPGLPSRTSSWARSIGPSRGVSGGVSSLFGTKIGRLVLAWVHRPSPAGQSWGGWLSAGRRRPRVQVLAPVAERLVAAATVAIPTDQAPMARTIIDRDLTLLAAFDAQIAEADEHLAALLPRTPFAVLCSGPGWRVVRAATYGAAVGDPARWPSARHVYRASGLCPATYASAGRRYDGAISREGSVTLRRAVLWRTHGYAEASLVNRPGIDGGSGPWRGWSHVSPEEVSPRAS